MKPKRGRPGFIKTKILVGLRAGTVARINRVRPKSMSRGAFIRQAIENEIGLFEAALRFYDDTRNQRLTAAELNPPHLETALRNLAKK